MTSNMVMPLVVLLIGLVGSDCNSSDFFDWRRPQQSAVRLVDTTWSAKKGFHDIDMRISDIIALNVMRFAQNVGQQLSVKSNENEIFSPASIMSALALLLLGASGRSNHELYQLFVGEYYEELRNHKGRLHEQLSYMLNDLQQEDVRKIASKRGVDPWRQTEPKYYYRNQPKRGAIEHVLKVSNGVFVQKGYTINRDYSVVINSIYKSKFSQLDFKCNATKARSYINDWVKLSTSGKIPSIIDDAIVGDTSVILASTLYFRAFWEYEFFKGVTRIDDFYPDGEDQPPIKVNLMATGGTFPYYNATEYGCQIIGLPYHGNLSTMYVIQPYQSSRSKLRQMQNDLDAGKIEDMISHMTRVSANVVFPKMHLKRSLNMKSMLQKMNVSAIFSQGSSDFSQIGTDPPLSSSSIEEHIRQTNSSFEVNAESSLKRLENQLLEHTGVSHLYVGEIIHKVDFNVDEEGTEAAAATVAILRKSGPEVTFRANAPFVLLIRHDPTRLILFYGIINEPPAASPTSTSEV